MQGLRQRFLWNEILRQGLRGTCRAVSEAGEMLGQWVVSAGLVPASSRRALEYQRHHRVGPLQRPGDWPVVLRCHSVIASVCNNQHLRPVAPVGKGSSQKKGLQPDWHRGPRTVCPASGRSCPSGYAGPPRFKAAWEPLRLGVGSPKQASSLPVELFMREDFVVG